MKNLALNISLASLILLGGCSLTESLFPSNETDSYSSSANLPILGTTNFEPIEISDGSDTGTFVGQKVVSFRQELSQLQESIKTNNEELQKIRASVTSNALAYHRNVGAMEAKLQVGTTPGNPNMYQALQNAQTNIQTMTMNMDAMNQLVARVTSDAAMTEYFDSETFSLGWNDTKPDGEWTRTGTFSGTSALIKYFPDGECWILITNTSTWRGPGLARYTEALFKKCRELYSPLLPERNMFSAAPGSRIFFRAGVLPDIQSPSLPEYVLTSNSPDNTL